MPLLTLTTSNWPCEGPVEVWFIRFVRSLQISAAGRLSMRQFWPLILVFFYGEVQFLQHFVLVVKNYKHAPSRGCLELTWMLDLIASGEWLLHVSKPCIYGEDVCRYPFPFCLLMRFSNSYKRYTVRGREPSIWSSMSLIFCRCLFYVKLSVFCTFTIH